MVMNDMTDDGKWGAAIEVNGVRPGYVSDDDMVEYTYGVPRGDGCRASHWSWDGDGRYYLKADHPHYQQTQPIDWSAPIEAVHEDGGVVAVDRRDTTKYSSEHWLVAFLDRNYIVDAKGSTMTQWRIRNVQPATQTQTLTAQERLEKYEGLLKRLAKQSLASVGPTEVNTSLLAEARALVAEMEPVDPDLIEARQIEHDILVEHEMDGTPALRGEWDDKPGVRGILRAVKRGRELARGYVA